MFSIFPVEFFDRSCKFKDFLGWAILSAALDWIRRTVTWLSRYRHELLGTETMPSQVE